MPVPGLSALGGSGFTVSYLSTQVDANPFIELGSPGGAVDVTVYIGASAELHATTGNPSLELTGFASGTRIRVINKGTIIAHGGDGARGEDGARYQDGSGVTTSHVTVLHRGGGGGGGAGFDGGAGGLVTSPATPGLAGTSSAGGAGGATGGAGGHSDLVITDGGQPGGDAINVGGLYVEIDNGDGFIYGGGGGGAPGILVFRDTGSLVSARYDAGAGGGLGVDGLPNVLGGGIGTWSPSPPTNWLTGGVAGFAVRGSAVTFLSGGTAPNVLGSVGV